MNSTPFAMSTTQDGVGHEPHVDEQDSRYERACAVLGTFFADMETCASMARLAVREARDELSLYAVLVGHILRLEPLAGPLEGADRDAVLTWVVKETSTLDYAEIGALMRSSRSTVAERIALVRSLLLA